MAKSLTVHIDLREETCSPQGQASRWHPGLSQQVPLPLRLRVSGGPSRIHSSDKPLRNSLKCFKTSGKKIVHMFRLATHA